MDASASRHRLRPSHAPQQNKDAGATGRQFAFDIEMYEFDSFRIAISIRCFLFSQYFCILDKTVGKWR
jgi:hypothetical protein